MPLANALLTPAQLSKPERTYPLDLVFCPQCSLVQITETVPPHVLFSDYVYLSSFSDTMVRHAGEIARRLVSTRQLGAASLVVELASNDGYLLRHYRDAGVPVLGIEPAANIAQVARDHGIPTIASFFDEPLAQRLKEEGRSADVIHANNVLAHVADLHGVVRGIELLLTETGLAVVEVPYVVDMIGNCEFDTIYHEHLCYFSLTALDRLFDSHGLRIIDVEHLAIHGGSLRIFVERADAPPAGNNGRASLVRLLDEETASGVDRMHFYADFSRRVETARAELVALVLELKSKGQRIAAYGASAKGSTLLNYCGIGTQVLDFVVDRSPVKQGHYMPGTRLPIHPPEKLLEDMPGFVLLLTWNFAAEILEQQRTFQERGGRFIIPVPKARVLGGN